ncbi:tRNA pseudouridine(38-40) synthase TruA [Tengunoibacter tsumagoiensis]|uniref:tRNA pseudouridine synthase A n=1 Tax=Tengunoibacter tsumagoiensis TaxID=2014871 RepID=A0A401ZTU6_9CHLR|nr:tRNA pseudouridine(38-40) synthase TruA [Tengunoibacter tsumagoiensis]GCE10348.1 tRNA pseudouridine synthase A [Tengunoibacter tsumagoiensis]
MNIACGIEYDGTSYRGFQRQPESHGATVQGTLEAAIARICGEPAVVTGAGRTDAGVHASGQVVHFRIQSHLTPTVWVRALNAVLPNTVAVRWAKEVPDRFHARFSALSRSYRYTIWNDSAPTALHALYSYHYGRPLDVELMQEACSLLVGRKDFGAFGHSPDDSNPKRPGPHSCVRTMLEARCLREGSRRLVYCDFTADAFLTGQVRRMVGTLLLVGQKRLCLEEFATIVQRAEKTHPGSAAPPHGLCLVRVEYPEKFGVTNDDEDI